MNKSLEIIKKLLNLPTTSMITERQYYKALKVFAKEYHHDIQYQIYSIGADVLDVICNEDYYVEMETLSDLHNNIMKNIQKINEKYIDNNLKLFIEAASAVAIE